MRITTRLFVLACLVGCGDDGGGDEGASTTIDASTSGGITGTTAGSTTATTAGSTGPGDGSTTGAGPTTSTTDAGACAPLSMAECENTPGCLPLGASRIVEDGNGGYCTEGGVFEECVDEQGCGGAITIACPAGTDDAHLIVWTCIPSGWEICAAPSEDIPEPCV